MNDEFSDIEELIKKFINKLTLKFPNIPVKRFDERFTSKIALQTMIDAGLNKKNRSDKYIIDKISATIILQGYLKSIEK
jgi:putative Holliday junction resolvase